MLPRECHRASLSPSLFRAAVVLVPREDAGVALDYVLTAPAAGIEHVGWTRALDVVISTRMPWCSPPAV
ncbi:MAG: hypothetical protein KUG77_11430 [Nannocystaceae bacterium]|nr:hypothetical protein [Nannocystaceae bacterium]